MAFRILNETELSLLDDNEREQYENELDIYLQRVAFVEQLEAQERIKVQQYEPKLVPIAVMGKIEPKAYTLPECAVSLCEPLSKPELPVTPFVLPESSAPILPTPAKRPVIEVGHIKNINRTSPTLPTVNKVSVLERQFGSIEKLNPDLPAVTKVKPINRSYVQPELEQINLPSVVKPVSKSNPGFQPVSIESENIQASLPKISMPVAALPSFVAPEKKPQDFPEVSVMLDEIKPYSKLERPNVQLPTAIKPEIGDITIKKAEPVQAELPELFRISPVNASFIKPEVHVTELPTVTKPNLNISQIQEIKSAKPQLPKVSVPTVQTDYHPIQKNVPIMPVVSKLSIPDRTFKPVDIAAPNLVSQTAPTVSVKPFEKINVKATGLPTKTAIVIPNAYESLKEFFPIPDTETEPLSVSESDNEKQ